MQTKVIVYSQKGCPHCIEMKESFTNENIFFEIEGRVLYFAPDRDWEEVNECVGMVKDLILWD